MAVEKVLNLIVGGGESGKYLGWTQARLGQKTVVIERSLIGGSCPNTACLPSKNIIHSAKVASLTANSDFGVITTGRHIDMQRVFTQKQKMVDGLIALNQANYDSSGVELVMGEAVFIAPRTVRVALRAGGTRDIEGERLFINTGSRAAIPDTPGLKEAAPLTHIEALNLQRLPGQLIIVGGGYVGLEFAQAYARFGSRVTVIHHGAQLLAREDPDIAAALMKLMGDEGVNVRLRAKLVRISGRSGESVTLSVEIDGQIEQIEGTDILIAAGRTANTDRLGLDNAGVQLQPSGYIQVDAMLRTTAENTWAMGDCAGSPQFTHVAFDDFRIVRDQLAGRSRSTRGRVIPYCLFTDPELAHVGLHENEAAASGQPYRVARLPMATVLRTRTLSETRGFMKAIVGADDQILGFTCFGAEATELLAVVQTAMHARLPYTQLREMIFTHPTAAEGLTPLFATLGSGQH